MLQLVSSCSSFVKMAVGLILLFEMTASGYRHQTQALSMNYYLMSCPMADMIVRDNVDRALGSDPTLAGPLLRMFFHDCWVQGCDASILIDSTKDNTAEKDSPANLSLRGYDLIDSIKEELEEQCPGVVSCADIITMAARDAVFLSGGPIFEVAKGRKDGRRSKIQDTFTLPSPFFNSSVLLNLFGQRGFTAQDLVALSGAHTLGVARCSSFKNRLTSIDTSMDSNFAKTLSRTCTAGDTAEQSFDATRTSFDNDYFQEVQRRWGVLFSDQTLYGSPRTAGLINGYALNQARFFLDFQQAFLKMSLLDIKDNSEVRRDCRKFN
ncbi:hypothetical protein V2J09_000679 [Rumex salicifolius]